MVSLEGLTRFIDSSQLPSDLNGNLHYNHQSWLEMRLAVEDCLVKASDMLDSYEDVKDQMEDLVTWMESDSDWKSESQPESEGGVEYLKDNLQRHQDIRKRIRSETVEQLHTLIQNLLQKYYKSMLIDKFIFFIN